MLKTYQSKKFINRSINITIDGTERVITFSGGVMYPRKVCGVYSTLLPKEQKAIESHPGFGIDFILIADKKTESKDPKTITLLEQPEVVQEDVVEEVNNDLPEDTEEVETVEEPVKITEVFEVEKVQEAKNWLMDKFPNEFTHRDLSNKFKILEVAKEKNISFPNIV